MRKAPLAIAILAVSLASGLPKATLAEETYPQCDFTGLVAEMKSIRQNSALSDLEEVRSELKVRRTLLAAAIACDENEMAVRGAILARLPDNIKETPAYKKIMEGFADASNYYEKKRESVPELGLQGTKDVSRVISSWREGTYIPLLMWADDLVLWSGNQQFITRVSGRLAQINRLAFSLKLVDQEEITDKFIEAQERFQVVIDENDKAKESLDRRQIVAAHGHIKASLKALSDTYDIFFDLQDKLKKIVQ